LHLRLTLSGLFGIPDFKRVTALRFAEPAGGTQSRIVRSIRDPIISDSSGKETLALRTIIARIALLAAGCCMVAACASGPPVTEPARVPAALVPAPERSQEARERYVMHALAPHQITAVEGMRLAGTGTGFFIAADRVLTNFHVIGGGCRALTVGNNTEGEQVAAAVVATNPEADLAVLSATAKDVRPADFMMGALMETREGLSIIGYPEHGLPVLEAEMGHVAVFQDDLEAAGRLFRFFGPVRRGNSGGPLLDNSGAVVGVVTAKLNTVAVYESTGAVIDDVGYAIGNRTVLGFFAANGIAFAPAAARPSLSPDEILKRAHQFVRQVGCWK
jgi:serine protease Do